MVSLFCLSCFSAVFPHISLWGHQSLMWAWLHMKWLDPILRCDRGLFCAGGSDGCVSELVTECSPPRLLRFGSLRGHRPLLSSFCRWSPTRLVLGRGKGSNWFLSPLWFRLWLSGAGLHLCSEKQMNKKTEREVYGQQSQRLTDGQTSRYQGLIEVRNVVVSFWIGFWKDRSYILEQKVLSREELERWEIWRRADAEGEKDLSSDLTGYINRLVNW